jgi:glycosyltransferase involved in cell wall biosynthesis
LLKERDFTPPSPFTVAIAGEGMQREALSRQAVAAGVADWISFPGFVADPRGWLASLHLYCQPSRREGLCIALHEAMQAGLPVIASRVGEMPYSIREPDCGLLVEPENERQLADALARMLREPEQLSTMGHNSRVRVLELFGAPRFEAAGRAILDRMASL